MSAKSKQCTLSVRITEEEKAKLVAYCEKHDVSVSQILRKAIRIVISK